MRLDQTPRNLAAAVKESNEAEIIVPQGIKYPRQYRFYHKNKERLQKRNAKNSLRYHYEDKPRAAAKAKAYRIINKERMYVTQKARRLVNKLKAIEYKGGKCVDCHGTFHPAVYEFHHLDPTFKDKDPSKVMTLKWEKIVAEIDKCVLLCANCHRIRHHQGV